MARHRVDMYLCGEVHAVTAIHRDGVTQISHGSPIQGRTQFMTGRVYGDRVELATHKLHVTKDDSSPLWHANTCRHPAVVITYSHPWVTGTMTLTYDNVVVSRDGLLAPYLPAPGTPGRPAPAW